MHCDSRNRPSFLSALLMAARVSVWGSALPLGTLYPEVSFQAGLRSANSFV